MCLSGYAVDWDIAYGDNIFEKFLKVLAVSPNCLTFAKILV